MTKHLVLVAGNIGAGKTSLAERLGERLGWHTAYESVDNNPYLADFYGNMRAWSFHLQVFFLGHRAEQHQDMANLAKSAIIDRSIYEDAHIFARVLYELGNMTERDYHSYRRLYHLVIAALPKPDLLIYIQAGVPTLIDHIRSRGREIEKDISPEYLATLSRFYDEWLNAFDLCPILTVPGDKLDFVHYPQHLTIIAERVQQKLAGKDEVEFPDLEDLGAG
ncbi:MAG: deoxynucleoside kinase [Anaerolineae bacterium]|nr:deoxynucleoside kinase [Anaerolineae bacterium]